MDILQTFSKPQILHAMAVHFPIVLAILGIPLVYLCTVVSTERNVLLWVALACYAILTATSFLATQSGHAAAALAPANLGNEAGTLLRRHEMTASKVWIFGAGMSILLILGFIRIRAVRVTVMALAMVGSLATGGWVAVVAHFGGSMVYLHGVGTPAMSRQVSPPVSEPQPPDREPSPPVSDTEGLIPLRPINPDAAAEVSYVRDVKPLFDANCVECHGETAPRGGLSLISVETMMRSGNKGGPGLIPGQPDRSVIVRYIRGELHPRMPKGREPLSANDLHVIRSWIAAGAHDDSKDDHREPAPVGSDVEPSHQVQDGRADALVE